MEEVEEKSSKLFWILLISIILIVIVIVVLVFWFLSINIQCGDGTKINECSMNKPYMCEDSGSGLYLISRAVECGCSKNLTQEGNFCNSKYQKDEKEISLSYFVDGEEGEIDYVVYKGMVDYVSNLSKVISYSGGQVPSREDFYLRDINNAEQRELILPLVIEIQNLAEDKTDQARIAISLVQNIFYNQSNKVLDFWYGSVNYSRYPYEVLYEEQGICGEKSELMALLLKELGFGVAILYYPSENHAAVGLKCPAKYSVDETGYCFVETTGPAIITDDEIKYVGTGVLFSKPEVFIIADGDLLENNLYEYGDAEDLKGIRKEISQGYISASNQKKFDALKERYNLVDEYYA